MKVIRSLLFLMLAIYFGQSLLSMEGSLISRFALVFIIVASFFYFIKVSLIRNKDAPLINTWSFFLLLNVLGFVFTADMNDELYISMFRSVVFTLLLFYPSYYLALRGKLTGSHLVVFLFMMLPIAILRFYNYEDEVLRERVSSKTEVVNNVAYTFSYLAPFVFLFRKNNIIPLGTVIIIMFFIIISGKRGAMLSGAITFILYFLYRLKIIEKRKRGFAYLVAFVLFCGSAFLIYTMLINNDFLLMRITAMAEGDTSGRNVIYDRLIDGWTNSTNIFNLLFGFGFGSALELSGGSFAHNDWLELLTNFGLLGIAVFLILYIRATTYFFSKRWEYKNKMLLVSILLVALMLGMVSRWYSSIDGFYISMLLGYLLGSQQRMSLNYNTA